MKKFLSLITALLILAMVPMSAFAIKIDIIHEFYEEDKLTDQETVGFRDVPQAGTKITADEFADRIKRDGEFWDLKGIMDNQKGSLETELEIPPMPEYGTEEFDEWFAKWGAVYVAYGLHIHASDVWYSDRTHHFQMCDDCWTRFNLNLHKDKDEDGICDKCECQIHYYTITVKEMEHGKIVLSKEKGALDERIDVTVIPDEGYVLKEIRFYNLNKQHSQLTRHEDVKGEQYHFIVLPWDIEIEADFVEAK
jgi:hypothetical protein